MPYMYARTLFLHHVHVHCMHVHVERGGGGKKKKKKNDPDVIRTRNLLIWSQTRYRCATESLLRLPLKTQYMYVHVHPSSFKLAAIIFVGVFTVVLYNSLQT